MSPLSDAEPAPAPAAAVATVAVAAAGAGAAAAAAGSAGGALETQRHLQGLSHRGYGAPVPSWNGTQSQMSRQVYIFFT